MEAEMLNMVTMDPKYLIYGLVDPRTLMVRYVGLSTKGLKRPKQHRSPSSMRSHGTHVHNWVKQLARNGLTFDIAVLQSSTPDSIKADEQWWIKYGRLSGWPLTNLTGGGDGALGYKASPEQIAKMRQRMLGTKQSPETIAKRARALRGRKRPAHAVAATAAYWTPERLAARSRKVTGQRRSADARTRMSVAQHNLAPDVKAAKAERMREFGKAQVFTDAMREKMRLAKLGKPQPVEQIAKRVAKLIGQQRTPEQRAKLSAIQQVKAAFITHCPRGHEYSAENLRNRLGKGRECRRCHYDSVARRNLAKRDSKVS